MKTTRAHCIIKFLLIVMAVGINACGWQLRGGSMVGQTDFSANDKSNFALNPVYAQNQRDFGQIFSRLLSSNEIKSISDADITIAFEKEKINRRAQAYGSTGIPIQYLLTMTISFEINNKIDQSRNIQRSVTSRRDYDFDAELVGPKDREQDALLKEMRQEIAQQILRIVYQSQR